MKRIAIVIILLLVVSLIALTLFVEAEAPYKTESLGGEGSLRALILFHPSREARFGDDLSLALAEGLKSTGLTVQRSTMTRDTPQEPKEFALIAVVSNTYWWAPDLPTQNYLARARLEGIPAIGLIGGAGATERSQRVLEEGLRATGAKMIQSRSFWLFRPNDEARIKEPNRAVAMEMAKQFGVDTGRAVIDSAKKPSPIVK
jgi:hypothetical protein